MSNNEKVLRLKYILDRLIETSESIALIKWYTEIKKTKTNKQASAAAVFPFPFHKKSNIVVQCSQSNYYKVSACCAKICQKMYGNKKIEFCKKKK